MATISSRPAVLFVDDEPASRDLAARVLIKAGFDVIAAADGFEAMKCFRARPDIRALISDIRMPKLNGVQLASMVRDCSPDIKVALITAYMDETGPLSDMDQWPVWIKPFDIVRLPELVAQLCAN